jgi:hypothetical protein
MTNYSRQCKVRDPDRYFPAVIFNECCRVRNAPIGTRNITLNSSAFAAARAINPESPYWKSAYDQFLKTALDCGIPASEANETLKSAFRAGERNPCDFSKFNTLGQQSPRKPSAVLSNRDAWTRKLAENNWNDAQPPAGTATATYIYKTRGIGGEVPASIRHHPACPRGKSESPLPALVGAVTVPTTGEFRAVHRIFLRADGSSKADLPRDQQKKSLGSTSGAAVVLGDLATEGEIIEGEGIETTLTVCWITGRPGIATLSAGTLGKPPLPEGRPVVILADLGAEDAARAGAQRRFEEGRQVRIMYPGGVR